MPDFPDRFGCLDLVVEHLSSVFDWYNNDHHHSGIGFLTPADVHFNRATRVIAQRQAVLDQAHLLHPERFARRRPVAPRLREAVWINPPPKEAIWTQPIHTNFQPSVSQNA